jgi:hypothetical protein
MLNFVKLNIHIKMAKINTTGRKIEHRNATLSEGKK